MSLLLRIVLVTGTLLLFSHSARAAHLWGADISYECLGNDQYEVTLNAYKDAFSGIQLDAVAFLYAINRDNNTVIDTVFAPRISIDTIPENNVGCVIGGPNVVAQDGYYKGIFNLPLNTNGYDIIYQRCCRTNGLANMQTPGGVAATYVLNITREGMLACNDGPRFINPPPILICNNSPIYFDNSVTDNDGDYFEYRFCVPLDGQLTVSCDYNIECPALGLEVNPFPQMLFKPGHSVTDVLGNAADPLQIGFNSGIMTGSTDNSTGAYQIAVCVDEFRNGVRMSSTVRDFQLRVGDCDIVIAATDPTITSCNRTVEFNNYSISADNWEWDFGDGNTSTDEFPVHTYATPGTYTVTLLAAQANICEDQTTAIVTVLDGPEAGFTTDPVCAGTPYTFNNTTSDPGGNVAGYEWTIEGTVYNSFEPTHTFSDTGQIDVQLIVFADSGCVDTAFGQMTVRDPAVLDVSIGDIYCSNLGVSFGNNSTGYIESVLWDFGDGSTSTDFEPTHDYATAGNYTVTVTLFNSFCGNQVYSETTDVQNAPPVDLGEPFEICGTGVTPFSIDTTGFNGAVVTWSTGDTGPTANIPGGTTLLSVSVDYSGCITSDSVMISNSASIVEDIDVPDVNCVGTTLVITNNSQGDIDAIAWDFGDGTTSGDLNPTHDYTSAGQYTITAVLSNSVCGNVMFSDVVDVYAPVPVDLGPPVDVCSGVLTSFTLDTTGFNGATVTWSTGDTGPTAYFDGGAAFLSVTIDNYGCLSEDSVSVISSDSIMVDIDMPETNCTSDAVAFINNSTGTTESVLWDFGDGNSSTAVSPTHTYAAPGDYTVTVQLVNSVCGSKNYSDIIAIRDPVALDLGPAMDICNGNVEVISIDTTGFNGASILWSTGVTDPSITVTGGSVTSVSVTVDNGCPITDQLDFNTFDSITVDIDIADSYCSGTSIVFTNNSTGDIESILWDFGDGNSSSEVTPTYTYATGGDYTITVDLFNSVCGSKSFSEDVFVQDPLAIDIGPDRDICVGYTEIFSIDTTGFNGADILWSTGETTPQITVTGGALDDLSVTVDNGCQSTDMLSINNSDSIVVDIQLEDTYCSSTAVDFINNSTGDIESITWNFGDGGTSSDFSPSHTYGSGGQYTVTADLLNSVCGNESFSQQIRLVSPLPVDLGATRDICPGLVDSFSIDTTGYDGASIIWSTGETTPMIYVVGGIESIGVTVDNGCITMDELPLTSECEIFTPTAFLPNGVNSEFNVLDVNIESYELRIYNRWGEQIFTTSSFDIGWDGTHDGVDAEMDVYVFIVEGIKIGGSPFLDYGSVALIR